jgi:DtxR family Mn-dependent transcriptional regulator
MASNRPPGRGEIMNETAQLSPSMEDYLEAILELSEQEDLVRVTDLAARLNIAKASVAQALSNLRLLKLVKQDRYGPVWLTDKGRAYAIEVRRRHQTLLRFLTKVLGVDPGTAEKDACQMEHAISPLTLERLVAFLDSNRYIPMDEEAAISGQDAEKGLKRLDELAVGDRAEVIRITATGALRRKLFDMGIVSGSEVVVNGVAPLGDPVEISVKGYHLSLRKAEAACVIARRI